LRGSHTTPSKPAPASVEQVGVVKDSAPIAKKAAAFAGAVSESYQTPEPRGTPVKVSDFDDIEGVKNRQKKWEEGQVVGSVAPKANLEGYKVDDTEELKGRKQKWEEGQVSRAESMKANVEGYKVEDTEEIGARKKKWEEGQVVGAEGFKANVEGYKVDDTEELKARKQKWEGGQVARAEGFKANVEGYKVEDTEEIGARKKKWEEGQVVGAAGTSTFSPEGYKLGTETAGLKDRLKNWSAVSTVPTVSPSSKKPVNVVEGAEGDPGSTASTKDRLKQWQDGGVTSPGRADSGIRAPVKTAESDVEGVKDRMNKWSEVTKDPEPAVGRKEPLNIYGDSNYEGQPGQQGQQSQ